MRTFSFLVASLGLAAGSLAFSTSSPQQQNSWNYLSCGSGNEPIQIKSFAVSPDPPQPGQDLTLTVKYEVTREIEEGYVHVSVKLGSMDFFQKRVDVCKKARGENASVGCHTVQPGSYTVVRTTALPKEIPLGGSTVSELQ